MSAQINSNSGGSRIHPLIAGASVAVILASVTAVAAITGILPTSKAVGTGPAAAPPAPPAMTQAAPQPAVSPAVAEPAVVPPVLAQAPVKPRAPAHRPASAHPATAPAQGNQYAGERAPAMDPNVGEVVSVTPVQASQPTTGLGALGGAVAGGLIGNQFGGGRGKVATTVVGAIGGGLAGNGIEHAVRKQTTYRVQVRMGDGSYRDFTYDTVPPVQVGERVRAAGSGLSAA